MFDLEHAIAEWRRNLFLAGIKDPAVLDELENHLRERVASLCVGLTEPEAFQAAVAQLGDAKNLKREFAKSRRWFPRDNPIELTLVAGCFIFMGLDAIGTFARLFSMEWYLTGPGLMFSYFGLYALEGLLLFVGLGLLRRVNFCRWCALIAVALNSVLYIYALMFLLLSPAIYSHGYFPMFGMMIPSRYQWSYYLVNQMMLLWGFQFLVRRTGRELFHRASKTRIA
jgi:hypothetical protein